MYTSTTTKSYIKEKQNKIIFFAYLRDNLINTKYFYTLKHIQKNVSIK